MAIASVGTLGTGANSTSNATFTFTTATNSLSAGDFGLLVVVADNISTADGQTADHTLPSGGTGTWWKLGEYTNSPGGVAGDGVTTSLWAFLASGTVNTGTTITVNFASNTTDKCCSFWKFTVAAGKTLALTTGVTNPITSEVTASNGFGSSAFSGLSSLSRLYFRALGKEANSTTDLTVSTSFTLITLQRSRNNAAAQCVRGEFRINTSTGETSNPTMAVSGDTAGLFVALEEVTKTAISGLTDNFDDNSLSANWSNTSSGTGTGVSETNQRLEVTGPTSTNTGSGRVATAIPYDMTGGQAYVSTPQAGNTAGTFGVLTMPVRLALDDGDIRWLIGSDAFIYAERAIAGTAVDVYSAAYSSSTHRWFRIRHETSDDKIYWDTAPSSASDPPLSGDWVNRWSEARTLNVTAAYVKLEVESYQSNAFNSGTAYFDGFNTATTTATVVVNLSARPGGLGFGVARMPERIPQSIAKRVAFRAYLSSDGVTPATGKTIAITISKNGGAFGNPAAGATNATEISSGFYYFDLGTGDTGTKGPLAWRGSVAAVNDPGDAYEVVNATNADFTALPAVAAEAAGGLYTRGTGAGQIAQAANGSIDARLADAVSHGGTLGSSTATLALSRASVVSQSSNTTALTATGNGTGHGAAFSSGSGATGNGIQATAASTNGDAIAASGAGTGHGFNVTGGATGNGIDANGGATSGDAINATAATSGEGIAAVGAGTTKHGIRAAGGSTSSDGIRATGGGTGHGLNAQSGSGATGRGINAVANSTNDSGLSATGNGTGDGIRATGGAGAGGDGIQATAGGGVDFRGNMTGDITGNLSGSAGSVTGAVGSVTGAVGSVTGAVGSVTGAVGSVTGAVGSVTARVTADVDRVDGAALTAHAAGKMPSDVLTVAGTAQTAGDIAGKTNSLTFTVAGHVDANTLKVGGTTQTAGDLAALINAVDDYVDTEITDIRNRLPAALTADGLMKSDTLRVGGTLQTAGDIPGKTNSLTFTAANQVDSNALAIADGILTAAKFAAACLTASKFAAGAIDAAALATDAAQEIRDSVWAKALTELAGVPASNAAALDALCFLLMSVRNKRTTTATEDKIHNDAGAAIATATLSDDSSTFSKEEYA